MTDQSYRQAHGAALRLLSYRPRSEAELRNRLNKRFPSPTVDCVVRSLIRQSLVDDRAFATLWAQSRDRQKPRSSAAIQRELVAKGVALETAASAASIVDDEESAIRSGEKFARQIADTDFVSFHRKLLRYLQRRGYSGGVIRLTVSRLWEDLPRTPPGSTQVN
ncbi:recombination regulator RecX [Dehalococcoidia bacterium]|nr:recombination regulator RecX [Dehalococcoidia bacterium]